MIIKELASWQLGNDAGWRRDAPRPPELRQPDYSERFDAHTVWYDAFWSPGRESVLAIAPPLLNLKQYLLEHQIEQGGRKLKTFTVEKDRIEVIHMAGGGIGEVLRASREGRTSEFHVGESHHAIFEGRRVLLTASKNNSLDWIEDWAKFNVLHNGADAVLLYDNGSEVYSLEELDSRLCSIPGLEAVVIVDWPFKWGPSAGDVGRWDSNFCQLAAWEHARWRFLQTARGCLACDVDELVFSVERATVFDLLEQASTGHLRYRGQWVLNTGEAADHWDKRRHRDFDVCMLPGVEDCEPKWAVVPWRSPVSSQWGAHAVTNMHPAEASEYVTYRHFRPINHSWKYDRESVSDTSGVPVGKDKLLRQLMDEIS